MSWFSKLFGDQSEGYDKYAGELDDLGRQYDPSIERGEQAGGRAYDQYGRLVDDPNSLQDQIAGGFSMSPYQKMLLDQMTQRMNYNAANTGMMGSGAANAALQDQLLGMSGQFMNDYINRGMGSYGMGLQGFGQLNQFGQQALQNKTNLGEEAAAGRLQGERSRQGWLPKLIGGGLGAAGAVFGGPIGGAIGSAVGGMMQGGGSTFNAGAR